MQVTHITDDRAWDERVAALGGHPLQSAAWGELKAAFGWRPLRLVTTDGGAAAQVLLRPMAGLAVAYVPRGPVLGGHEAADRALLDAIKRAARRHRAAFARLEPAMADGSPEAGRFVGLARAAGFRPSETTLQPRATLVTDLAPDEATLLASFSKGHRADIRRAQRDGVSVRDGSPEEAGVLHSLLRSTQARKSFGIHSAEYYRKLLRSFGDAARLLIAEHEGAAVAATIALAWGGHGIYLVAGSDERGLRHRAGHLLQWHAIRWARDRGCRTYDLWGIPDARARLLLQPAPSDAERARLEAAAAADPLDGVFRFKKGWAAKPLRTLAAYDRVYFPPAYWLWQRRRGTSA